MPLKKCSPVIVRFDRLRCWKIAIWFALIGSSAVGHSVARDLSAFVLGVNTHRVMEKDAVLLRDLGPVSSRVDVLWEEIANEKGVVIGDHKVLRSIQQLNLQTKAPVVILDYGHPWHENGHRPTTPSAISAYAAYAKSVVSALSVSGGFFEIWNEWNAVGVEGSAPGTNEPIAYVNVLRESYTAIKATHPEAFVLGGSISGNGIKDGWLKTALDAGMLDCCDGLSFHPYFYNAKGGDRLPEIGLRNKIHGVLALLDHYPEGRGIPLFVTELGWPTFDGPDGLDPAGQAKFLARSVLVTVLEPRIRGLWIYELRDAMAAQQERENHFGLTLADGTPKPAYAVMQDLARLLTASVAVEEIANLSNGELLTLKLSLKSGSEAWLCWTTYPQQRAKVELVAGTLGESVHLRPLGTVEASPLSPNRTGSGGTMTFEVGDTPVLVIGAIKRSFLGTHSLFAVPNIETDKL